MKNSNLLKKIDKVLYSVFFPVDFEYRLQLQYDFLTQIQQKAGTLDDAILITKKLLQGENHACNKL